MCPGYKGFNDVILYFFLQFFPGMMVVVPVICYIMIMLV